MPKLRQLPTRPLRLEQLAERINPVISGTLDTSFNNDGIALVHSAPSEADVAQDVVLQPDGKIVAVGTALTVNGNVPDLPLIVRLNTDGSLDRTFSTDGIAYIAGQSATVDLYGVDIQSDGKIVVTGTSRAGGNFVVFLARFQTNGTLDPSFGPAGTGIVTTDRSLSDDNGFTLAIQHDDMIIVGGNTRSDSDQMLVLRYSKNGVLDTDFGTDGMTVITAASSVQGLALQADHKIVVVGYGNNNVVLARLDASGDLDPTFDGDGIVSTDILDVFGEQLRGVALQSDQRIVAVGVAGNQGLVMRYDDEGQLDESFGTAGLVRTPLPHQGGAFENVAIDHVDQIVAVGSVGVPGGGESLMARYLPDGELDRAFHGAGQITVPGLVLTDTAPGDNDDFYSVAIQPNGNIVAVGRAGSGTIHPLAVVRYLANPPLVEDDSYTTPEDVLLVVVASGVLSNDTLPGAGSIPAIYLVEPPEHGDVVLNDDGSFVYTPNLDYHGTDRFRYIVVTGGTSEPATVNLTITSVEDEPRSGADEYIVGDDSPLIVAAAGVLANDTAVEEQPLTATLLTPPSIGSLTNFNTDGSFTFAFPPDFYGSTTFTYRANDGLLDGPSTTVTLTRLSRIRVVGSILEIGGSEGRETVRIVRGAGSQLKVEMLTPQGYILQTVAPARGFRRLTGITAYLGGGDDWFDSTAVPLPVTIVGGLGSDVLVTGRGNDVVYGDLINGEGNGNDTLDAGHGRNTVVAGHGNNIIRTGGHADHITAGHGHQYITTGAGNDTVVTGNGNQYIQTEAGNDLVTIGIGTSVVDGGAGNDIIRAVGGRNWLYGGTGHDQLFGGNGNDDLDGGAGRDLLVGGFGSDRLIGGAGDDLLFDGLVHLKYPATDSFAKIVAAYRPTHGRLVFSLATRLIVPLVDVYQDTLTGGRGRDWFWSGNSIDVLDRLAVEPQRDRI